MRPLVLSDLLNIYEYEKQRDEIRREIIAYKSHRRFQLGSEIVLTFENRKTMSFQVQEMMRAERMVKDEQIQEELDIYNQLLPSSDRLSATLFIEITRDDQIREVLHKFLGMTNGNSVFLQVGDERIAAEFEGGREEDDRISSVHYVTFSVSSSRKAALLDESQPASILIDYNDYQYSAEVSAESRRSLLADLE